jgi:predicted AAA+ superfamily ATPase
MTPDYSYGTLKSMVSPFFPQMREKLGPFLVDKTELIERIIKFGLRGDVDLVLRPRRCSKTTTLQMIM